MVRNVRDMYRVHIGYRIVKLRRWFELNVLLYGAPQYVLDEYAEIWENRLDLYAIDTCMAYHGEKPNG